MYYFMITTAAFLFSLQFLFTDRYQKECGSSFEVSLKFTLYSSLTGFIMLFFMNKFNMQITLFSVVVALFYSIVGIVSSYCSIKAFEYANLSVYSVFSMIGGMLLPFIYGLFYGEEFKLSRLVCCLLITLSVAMSIDKGKHGKKAMLYYIAVFILNGLVGVISKFHQSNTGLCVDSSSFMLLTKVISTLFCTTLLIFTRDKSFCITKKAFLYCVGFSFVNSIGNLMLLIALLHLPASVQYPIVTGGVIIFSVIIDLIRREKVTKKELTAAAISFIASVFMAF